jgi:hypothetical protein
VSILFDFFGKISNPYRVQRTEKKFFVADLLLATCYLLLATCYLLLATCYLLAPCNFARNRIVALAKSGKAAMKPGRTWRIEKKPHNKLVCARACKQAKKRGKKKMGSSSKTNAATTRGKIKEKKDEFNQIFSDRKSWGSSAIEEICEEFKENWQAEFQKKFVAANSKFLSISRFTTTRVYLLLLWGRGKLKARTK